MISFVIPAFNEERRIAECLESIATHAVGAENEIIVIDNASTDRTAAVAQRFPGVRVVREPRKGVAFARNRGLEEARGDLIAFIDADTRITPEWIPVLRQAFARNENLVCLSGPYYFDDLSFALRNFIWCLWGASSLCVQWLTGHMITGGNFVAKKNALVAIGGFDTRIHLNGDDVNIGRRLHAIGPMSFRSDFYARSSGRRIRHHGFLKVNSIYGRSFLSEMLFHKPFEQDADDVR